MPNLSQIKRQRMLEFLNKIREEHTDDESLIAINEIEMELTNKKYGLVWEEHEERVDVEMKHNVPVFTEIVDREIVSDSRLPYNFLIEGDNLHSLKLLEKTHKGRIDLIYIDPPYNTGKKDFIYCDEYVAKDDAFRHSKWLSFMYNRLQIAKKLLSENGVIFISIDDNEQANLKLLCDCIFGEENFVSLLSVENNPKGRKNSNFVSVSNDYCLIYARDIAKSCFIENIPKDIKDLAQDENGDYVHNSGKRVLVGENNFNGNVEDFGSDKHYTVYFNRETNNIKTKKEDSVEDIDEILCAQGYERYYSYNSQGFVLNTYTESKLLQLFQDGALDFKNQKIYEKNFSTNIRIKSIVTNKKYKAVVNNSEIDYVLDVKTTSAKTELKNMFGFKESPFSNPKNTGLIKLLISLIEDNNITVLDFFAGSGTTAQSVIELNASDHGTRKFILCTNNENNICEEVTYPRCKIAISGIRPNGTKYSDGYSVNFKYYKTDFIVKRSDESDYAVSDELLKHIAEMVQLEYAVKLDGTNYILAMSDEEADDIIANKDKLDNCKALYISAGVLLTAEQQKELTDREIKVFVIPDYYFETELLEVGER